MQPLLRDIVEKGFPLEVKKRSNEHSRLFKRQKIIQYGETALPKWEQTDADETITLPMSLKAAATRILGFALSAVNTDANPHSVRVKFGTVSPQLGAALNSGVDAWPTGMNDADDPPLIIPISAATQFYLVATSSDVDPADQKIYSVTVATRSGADIVPARSVYLGAANIVAGKSVIIENMNLGSQGVIVCGSQVAFYSPAA